MSSAKSNRRLSLGLRLSGWYLGVFLLSTLLLVSVAGFRIRSSIHEKVVETVTTSLREQKQMLETQGIAGLKKLAESPDEAHRSLYVRLLDGSDQTLFEHRSTPDLSFDSETKSSATDVVRHVHADNDGSTWSLSTTSLANGRRLQLAISDDQTREVVGHLRAGLLAVWIAAVALGLLGAYVFTRRALRPIQVLAATARQVIDSGDLALRVPVRGTDDELDEVSQLFNGVLARNQALVTGMREALDNVAHDLRTPLTRLRTGAEVALQGDATRTRDALADTIEESERVLSMLTTLMDISEAETGVMKLALASVDLSELAREAVDLYQHVADERGVRLLTHLGTEVNTNGDRQRLSRVVANLLDNAIKYTATGGVVELTTAREDTWACIRVKDSGAGIAAADLPRIWDRLYRADQSRSERGLGLGLSFVRAIVEAHEGQTTVESELGVGSTFEVRLPVR